VKWPLANGNWSNAANWNDGTLPDVGDDVHADGKTVTIDQDVSVLSIRNDQRSGGTINGGFQLSGGKKEYNIVGNVFSGSAQNCLSLNTINNIITLTGNVYGPTGVNSTQRTLSVGTFNILNIIGNVFSTSVLSSTPTLVLGSDNIINIIGNVSASNSNCIEYNNNSTINVTGIVTGGVGSVAININNGYLNITGLANGGTSGAGVNIQSATVQVIIDEANGGGSAGVQGSGQNTVVKLAKSLSTGNVAVFGDSIALPITVNNLDFNVNGRIPVAGSIRLGNDIDSTVKINRQNNTTITLVDAENLPNELPAQADVRESISYNDGNRTGTMAVPVASNVRKDVPVDDTVGTADLTAEDILNAILTSENPVAERLRNVSTVQTTGDQIAGS
jgi:hypothetical protein